MTREITNIQTLSFAATDLLTSLDVQHPWGIVKLERTDDDPHKLVIIHVNYIALKDDDPIETNLIPVGEGYITPDFEFVFIPADLDEDKYVSEIREICQKQADLFKEHAPNFFQKEEVKQIITREEDDE